MCSAESQGCRQVDAGVIVLLLPLQPGAEALAGGGGGQPPLQFEMTDGLKCEQALRPWYGRGGRRRPRGAGAQQQANQCRSSAATPAPALQRAQIDVPVP
jgi:hypothetical protein